MAEPLASRSRILEPALSIVFTISFFTLGTVILMVTVIGVRADPIQTVIAMVSILGWKVVIWTALVVWIAVKSGQRSPTVRAGLAIAVAPLAVVLSILIDHAPMIFTSAGGWVVGLFSWIPELLTFTACAAIGAFTAAAVVTARRGANAMIWTISVSTLLAVGGALAFALVWQFFEVYFTLWNPAVVTEADGMRYLWTAGSAIALVAAGVLVAIIQRQKRLVILGGIIAGLALIFAFVFQVPQGRWIPENGDPAPYNSNYVPCYGEGDPNCIGG